MELVVISVAYMGGGDGEQISQSQLIRAPTEHASANKDTDCIYNPWVARLFNVG